MCFILLFHLPVRHETDLLHLFRLLTLYVINARTCQIILILLLFIMAMWFLSFDLLFCSHKFLIIILFLIIPIFHTRLTYIMTASLIFVLPLCFALLLPLLFLYHIFVINGGCFVASLWVICINSKQRERWGCMAAILLLFTVILHSYYI